MLRKLIRASFFAAFGAVAVAIAYGSVATAGQKDKENKVPTISEIMTQGHKGTDAYIAKIRGAAKDGKWEEAEKYAKTLAFFGENLGKNKPPKGDAKSWEMFCKAYTEATKAVYKGTMDKDAKAVNKSLGGINCGGCHKAHK
jgi:hypothetical protein